MLTGSGFHEVYTYLVRRCFNAERFNIISKNGSILFTYYAILTRRHLGKSRKCLESVSKIFSANFGTIYINLISYLIYFFIYINIIFYSLLYLCFSLLTDLCILFTLFLTRELLNNFIFDHVVKIARL